MCPLAVDTGSTQIFLGTAHGFVIGNLHPCVVRSGTILLIIYSIKQSRLLIAVFFFTFVKQNLLFKVFN